VDFCIIVGILKPELLFHRLQCQVRVVFYASILHKLEKRYDQLSVLSKVDVHIDTLFFEESVVFSFLASHAFNHFLA
jgi:hypothetical protein